MAIKQPISTPSLVLDNEQPLISVFLEENGRQFVCYFSSEDEADAALPDDSIQYALDLAGAWSDLPWDEMEAALDDIRHQSRPTPPIDDL